MFVVVALRVHPELKVWLRGFHVFPVIASLGYAVMLLAVSHYDGTATLTWCEFSVRFPAGSRVFARILQEQLVLCRV